jgi:8-hydroxy-5-deazaflavin:NADPH oxidoreductase
MENVTKSKQPAIAIVGGTGAEGMGLALRWARAGVDIVIGSRETQRASDAATEISTRAGAPVRVRGMENSEAVAVADVVVLTVPFSAHAATLKKLKPALRSGTVLIDTTVPLASSVGGPSTRTLAVWQGSAAQQAAELVPPGVAVAATLHNLSATSLGKGGPVDCDVIVCTDDEGARQVAGELIEKIAGARAINGGKLENARIVEQLTALLITINMKYKVAGAGFRMTGLPIPDPRK